MGYDKSMHINAKQNFIPSSPEGEVCFFNTAQRDAGSNILRL
jgi:hypothetical protein